MNNRIEKMFEAKKADGKKALITFVTAGDPDIATTERLVHEMIKEGADLVELGVPYSDPIAEGPVIQAANERAMKNKVRLGDIFSLCYRLRATFKTPFVLLLYVNCIVQYGADRFFKACHDNGVDAVIVPDLPFEERGEIADDAKRHDVQIITMVSPISDERIKTIAKDAEGFLYCVSSLGVTGVRSNFETDFNAFFQQIRSATSIPTAIGFGISNGEQAAAVREFTDGVIVGSAFVKRVGEAANADAAVQAVGALTRELRLALN